MSGYAPVTPTSRGRRAEIVLAGRPRPSRALIVPLLVAGFVALLVGVGGYVTGALEVAENESVDLRYDVRGVQPAGEFAIVAIDEDTFSELRTTWPLPRTLHARVIDRLRRAGAEQIVYDVQFTEPSPQPAADVALFRAVERAGHVILATGESDDRGRTSVLGGDENLAAAGARAAAANFPADDGGVIRRYPREVARLPSIATATAERLGVPVSADRFQARELEDRLPRPARHLPDLLVLRRGRGARGSRAAARADRRRGSLGAHAPGCSPGCDRRFAPDVRARASGQCDLDRASTAIRSGTLQGGSICC